MIIPDSWPQWGTLSKIAFTMEIYTEVPDQAAREVLRRLGEQFDG